jgi:pilus assembly protein Flp/PilA
MSGLRALGTETARQVRSFCKSESGATSIEYALIAAGVSIVIVVAVNAIGTSVKGSFESVSNKF